METLQQILNADGVRPEVIKDCVIVIEQEVQKKRGVIGFAVKQGFNLVRKLENGRFVEKAVDKLVDDFVIALEPYHQSFKAGNNNGQSSFAGYLISRDEEVSESLLGVTDAKRDHYDNRVAVSAYDKLRSSAKKQVKEAVPAVGNLMQKYAFQPV